MSGPKVLANAVGLPKPTVGKREHSTLRALSPRVEQGGSGDRRDSTRLPTESLDASVRFVVGLAGPSQRAPSADPTQSGFAPVSRCRRQRGGDPGGRRLYRDEPSLLTGLGRLTPTTNRARREFPLDPLPLRAGAADRLGSSASGSGVCTTCGRRS